MSEICEPSQTKKSASNTSKSAPKSKAKRRQTQHVSLPYDDAKSEKAPINVQKSAPAAQKKSKTSSKNLGKVSSKRAQELKQGLTKEEIMRNKTQADTDQRNKELLKSTKKSKVENSYITKQGQVQVTLERKNMNDAKSKQKPSTKKSSKGKVQKQQLPIQLDLSEKDVGGEQETGQKVPQLKEINAHNQPTIDDGNKIPEPKSTLKRDRPQSSKSVNAKVAQLESKFKVKHYVEPKASKNLSKSKKDQSIVIENPGFKNTARKGNQSVAKLGSKSSLKGSLSAKLGAKSKSKGNLQPNLGPKSTAKGSLTSKADKSEAKLGISSKKQKV